MMGNTIITIWGNYFKILQYSITGTLGILLPVVSFYIYTFLSYSGIVNIPKNYQAKGMWFLRGGLICLLFIPQFVNKGVSAFILPINSVELLIEFVCASFAILGIEISSIVLLKLSNLLLSN